MNNKYGYWNIEEWYHPAVGVKKVPIEVLIDAICSAHEPRNGIDVEPKYRKNTEELKRLPEYHYKTGCIDDPEMIEELAGQGLHYGSFEMGAMRWLVVVPEDVLKKQDSRIPLLVVYHRENYFDPFWAMKTLEIYAEYIKKAGKNKFTILFIVPNFDGPVNIFAGIITEGIQCYCGDRNKVLIDLSLLVKNGKKLKDIEGFNYAEENGTIISDPDSRKESLYGIPVLNFSRRWIAAWKPHKIDGAGDGTVDAEWLIHSETGRKMLIGNKFAMKHKSPSDPAVQEYWSGIGLNYGCHYIHDERWVIFTPKDHGIEKLPVVVCISEVNEPDDNSILRSYNDFEVYCNIAAQGDCAVIFFAMESPELNDWICDILADAEKMYPVDLSRVYMTGHSHNGHFTQEFARRHPNTLACIAPLGNSPGLPTPEVSHEAVAVDDAKATVMETMDMPTCIVCGCKEVGGMVPVNKKAHAFEPGINVEGYAASAEGKIAMWQRRLKAERCPQQSKEEILRAAESTDKTERMLGFPSDRTEVLYLDGFEHYIADIKNNDGKSHFRVVAIENMPHMTLPSMHLCAWNYMRRFARNRDTGEIIELM